MPALDLIPSALFDATGVGAPVYVGRNRTLALTLTVSEVEAAGTLDVVIETAASQQSKRWRTLYTVATQGVAGTVDFAPTGCDEFIRARYTLSSGAVFAFNLSGAGVLSLLDLTTLTDTNFSTPVDVGQYHAARLMIDVEAHGGLNPTLDIVIQTANSAAATTWRDVLVCDRMTSTGAVDLVTADLDRFVRVGWTVGGDSSPTPPSFAVGVTGESIFIFARTSERAHLGVRGGAIQGVSATDTAEAMITASAIGLGSCARYELPLKAWGPDFGRHTTAVADWFLLSNRGGEPSKGLSAELYRLAYEDATGRPGQRGWFDKVAARDLSPPGVVDSTAVDTDGGVRRISVVSTPLRGWVRRVTP